MEFSKPTIQGFDDYTDITNIKGIMYYYYTIKIYKKYLSYDKYNKDMAKYSLVSTRMTYDFPCITELKDIIEYQLKNDPKINGQKDEYRSGLIEYRKTLSTEGFACDDFYEITKLSGDEDNEFKYIVYVGTTYDSQGDLNSVGIRTPYVTEDDIKELLKCVNSFIKYSIDLHNKSNYINNDRFKIIDNKIYEYKIENNKTIK